MRIKLICGAKAVLTSTSWSPPVTHSPAANLFHRGATHDPFEEIKAMRFLLWIDVWKLDPRVLGVHGPKSSTWDSGRTRAAASPPLGTWAVLLPPFDEPSTEYLEPAERSGNAWRS